MALATATQAGIVRIKNYYLKGVLGVYVIAFASLYVQLQALFGDNGVVPLRDYAARQADPSAQRQPLDAYNLILLAPKLKLSHATFVELTCILGVVLAFSAIFVRRLANAFTFTLLWYIYFSICNVGQGFMSFHSDLLLLEVGLISVLIAPLLPTSKLTQADHDHMTFFLIKWLVFRYFVTNVFNVYLDGDQAWYSMTAIPMVANGVQFPSMFTWQIFNMPEHILKLYQAYEHTIKLTTPFLILFDFKYTRCLAFWSMLFISLPAALFYNFGWTDLLISVCLLTYLRDSYLHNDKRSKQSNFNFFLDMTILGSYLGVVTYIIVKWYGLKYVQSNIILQVVFTPAQFKLLVDHLVPASFLVGLLSLIYSTKLAVGSKKTSTLKTFFYGLITIAIFFSTFPTMTKFAPNLENKVKILAHTKTLSRVVAPYHLSNNYLILSKVSTHYAEGRPEVQIQVREPDEPTWQQFEFRYKPGNPSRSLSRVVPHIPRVDLKMWYAARSSMQSNQWIQNLAYRLATNENAVVSSIAPTAKFGPKSQIRAVTLVYNFSDKSKQPTGYWLQPTFKEEYMPKTSVETLRAVVKANGLSLVSSAQTEDSNAPGTKSVDKVLSKYLEISGDFIKSVDPTSVVWTLAAIVAVSMVSF